MWRPGQPGGRFRQPDEGEWTECTRSTVVIGGRVNRTEHRHASSPSASVHYGTTSPAGQVRAEAPIVHFPYHLPVFLCQAEVFLVARTVRPSQHLRLDSDSTAEIKT